jgi:hypothetical protein
LRFTIQAARGVRGKTLAILRWRDHDVARRNRWRPMQLGRSDDRENEIGRAIAMPVSTGRLRPNDSFNSLQNPHRWRTDPRSFTWQRDLISLREDGCHVPQPVRRSFIYLSGVRVR